MQKVITHSGSFHTDDVFAVATLQLHFGVENVEVIRTRDEAIIAEGDIVVDVGGVYDAGLQRFDHHQTGAPVRDNGIPYAAFGLVWKEYGEQVVGSGETAVYIEERLVLPVDAGDNGVSLFNLTEIGVSPATLQDIVSLYKPEWGSTSDIDEDFLKVCTFARQILERAISHANGELMEQKVAIQAYKSANDKRVIVSEYNISGHFFTEYPDCLFLVSPREDGNWKATAVRESHGTFATKLSFPESWRGLRDNDLLVASGVSDAIFCHKAGFLFVAKSKEGALEAVKKTLNQ